jgi:ATP-binding cassette subfamily C (CFTR/MRP) protein 4
MIPVLGVIIVVALVNYWMLIPTVVMLVLFFMLRVYYIATSHSIKRLEGIRKLIVFLWITLYFIGEGALSRDSF